MTLTLLPLDPDLARGLACGALPHGHEPAEAAPLIAQVAAACLALYERTGAAAPWTCYLATEPGPAGARAVGSCGFKDAPRDGIVEIAYFTFPGHEGRGVARAMAAALLAIAEREPQVAEVRAHTLPEAPASIRILTSLGFRREGLVQDPEDGEVVRWTRELGRRRQE